MKCAACDGETLVPSVKGTWRCVRCQTRLIPPELAKPEPKQFVGDQTTTGDDLTYRHSISGYAPRVEVEPERILSLRALGMSYRQINAMTGASKSAIYRVACKAHDIKEKRRP